MTVICKCREREREREKKIGVIWTQHDKNRPFEKRRQILTEKGGKKFLFTKMRENTFPKMREDDC